jgi:hypothetical protein
MGYFAYTKRLQILAKTWHWKHGYTARLADYEVPVPGQWLVGIQSYGHLQIMNIAPGPFPRDGLFHTLAVINVSLPLQKQHITSTGMDYWISFQHQKLEGDGIRVEEKKLDMGNESITCIGGNELRAVMRNEKKFPDSNIISLTCRSDEDLSIMFVGEPRDVQDFYDLVSSIHRVK